MCDTELPVPEMIKVVDHARSKALNRGVIAWIISCLRAALSRGLLEP